MFGDGGAADAGGANGAGPAGDPVNMANLPDVNNDGVPDSMSNYDSIVPIVDENGNITGYQVTGETDSGTQVTSVMGSGELLAVMANDMANMINDPALQNANGEPLIPELAQFAQAFEGLAAATSARDAQADSVAQLAALFEASGPMPNPNGEGPQTYPPEMVEGVLAITEAYLNMGQLHGAIEAQLTELSSSNPTAFESLSAQFSEISNSASGVVATATMPGVFDGLQAARINPADVAALSGDYSQTAQLLVGVQMSTASNLGPPPTPPTSGTAAEMAMYQQDAADYYAQYNAAFIQGANQTVSENIFGNPTQGL